MRIRLIVSGEKRLAQIVLMAIFVLKRPVIKHPGTLVVQGDPIVQQVRRLNAQLVKLELGSVLQLKLMDVSTVLLASTVQKELLTILKILAQEVLIVKLDLQSHFARPEPITTIFLVKALPTVGHVQTVTSALK